MARCYNDSGISRAKTTTQMPTGAAVQDFKWSDTNLLTFTYTNIPPGFTLDIYNIIPYALKIWSNVIPIGFKEVKPNEEANLYFSFAGPNFVWNPDEVARTVFDQSKTVNQTWFKPNVNWVDNPNAPDTGTEGLINFRAIACHECGHALFMAHSNIQQALMWWEVPNNAINLQEDDIEGITFLYGRRAT